MYQTVDAQHVRNLETGDLIALGTWCWEAVQAWLDAGNALLPATWVDPGDARRQLNVAINTWRTQMENSGFPALDHWWDSDDMARERLTLTLLAGQGSPVGYWKDVENNAVAPGDAAMIATLYGAMVEYGALIFARAEQMKAEVAALAAAQLADYRIGWPLAA
ncbi:DUF4376 domain-containing protein [Chitiniphilus eburneus]|uniref:DUF4376 domain-containing protein n=1 Tax=Chitiniphilus eburneus TaxID=2571148 RepID=A0A4U0P4X9_9NEIS|nr:DUF4376 domain-containing protein [Chitiniphilus eburneus]TJZ61732.1 DUF4376 domain-containing protein [Chitiniphilus eburneus]